MALSYHEQIRWLLEKGITPKILEEVLSLPKSEISKRLTGETDWSVSEVVKIHQFLENSNMLE